MGLFRVPGFAILFVGRTLNMFGSSFAPVALAFAVLAIPGATAGTLSMVLAGESIPMVALLLVGGVIADRFRRDRVLMISQIFAAAAFGGLATLVAVHAPVGTLVAAAVLSGVGIALGWPALSGIIPEIVPTDRLQQGNAALGFGASVARIVGVVASGVVVAFLGGPLALVAAAALFLITGVLVFWLPDRRAPGTRPGAPVDDAIATEPVGQDPLPAPKFGVGQALRDLAGGWKEFVSHEWLWVIVAQWSLLVMCFTAAHAVLGPVIAEQELGGAQPWSWVLAGEAVGEVVAVVVAMRLRPSRPLLLPVVLTAVLVPIPFVLLGLGAPLWSVIAAMVPMGFSFTLFGVLWNTTMQREVPPEALSRVSSYDAMGSLIFGPVGLLVAGPAADAWGIHAAMTGCGVLLFVIGVVALASRDVRTLTWRPAAEEPAVTV